MIFSKNWLAHPSHILSFQSFGLFLSTYLVVVIGLDRWIAISQPLKRSQGGRSRARVWTWTAWILSAILSLPQVSKSGEIKIVAVAIFQSRSFKWSLLWPCKACAFVYFLCIFVWRVGQRTYCEHVGIIYYWIPVYQQGSKDLRSSLNSS